MLNAPVIDAIVRQTAGMLASQGGRAELVSVENDIVRVNFVPGSSTCEGDACMIPSSEFRELLSERLDRIAGIMSIIVEVIDEQP